MLQERLCSRLKSARSFTERLLEDFSDSNSWVYQITPDANHALWFVGHMGVTDNFMISVLNPDLTSLPDGYAELFGIGSQPVDDIASYPDVQLVCEFMRGRREVLLSILNTLAVHLGNSQYHRLAVIRCQTTLHTHPGEKLNRD
jgi:hypothetical protein